MNHLIVFALLLGTSGCVDIQAQGFVPWRQAAARFQQAYNACHEDKSCSDKAWANYRAELAAFLPRIILRERFYHLAWDFDPFSALVSSYRCVTFGSISFWAASDPNSALGSEAKAGLRRGAPSPACRPMSRF
jgi:hypothetical protein